MTERLSLTARIYEAVKAEMKAGTFPPGYPISAASVARRFSSSIIPVREALYRLVGERLVEARDHDGFYAPRISEVGLRDLYRWQHHLLHSSLEDAFKPALKVLEASDMSTANPSLATVEMLFRALADKSGNQEIGVAIHNTLDRVLPIALVRDQLAVDWASEYANLLEQWHAGDVRLFKDALLSYNHRRIEMVPELVERLNMLRPGE